MGDDGVKAMTKRGKSFLLLYFKKEALASPYLLTQT